MKFSKGCGFDMLPNEGGIGRSVTEKQSPVE
jgi:hypothetical protein